MRGGEVFGHAESSVLGDIRREENGHQRWPSGCWPRSRKSFHRPAIRAHACQPTSALRAGLRHSSEGMSQLTPDNIDFKQVENTSRRR